MFQSNGKALEELELREIRYSKLQNSSNDTNKDVVVCNDSVSLMEGNDEYEYDNIRRQTKPSLKTFFTSLAISFALSFFAVLIAYKQHLREEKSEQEAMLLPHCFEDGEELKDAVRHYTNNIDVDALITKYGYPIGSWCVSEVKDFAEVFKNAYKFNEDISGWDVSKGTHFQKMFLHAEAFNQPIGIWSMSMALDTAEMFKYAYVFNQKLSSWNVSNVITMSNMFYDAHTYNHSLNDWDVSNVRDMNSMFQSCFAFNQPIYKWNTSKVETMNNLFDGAVGFNQDITNWDVSKVTKMKSLFEGAESFNQDLSKWDTSNVITTERMFYKALEFNQNLCEWGKTLRSKVLLETMFEDTACSNIGKPIFPSDDDDDVKPGPFCHDCSN